MADQRPVGDEAAPWLSLVEASSRLGISVDAIRSRIRRGALAARRGNDGRLAVQVPADLRLGDDEIGDEVRLGGDQTAAHQALVAELQHEVGELRVELARAEERVKAAEAVARADVEAARRAAEEAITARDGLLVELRRGLEREQARADRLEADARRPWWRRLVG